MTDERPRFDWEREHSPFTVEGQIEAAGAFGRGLGRHRRGFQRVLLALIALLVIVAVLDVLS